MKRVIDNYGRIALTDFQNILIIKLWDFEFQQSQEYFASITTNSATLIRSSNKYSKNYGWELYYSPDIDFQPMWIYHSIMTMTMFDPTEAQSDLIFIDSIVSLGKEIIYARSQHSFSFVDAEDLVRPWLIQQGFMEKDEKLSYRDTEVPNFDLDEP